MRTNFHHIHVIVTKEINSIQVGYVNLDNIHDVWPSRAEPR